jgi:hypothetical protein
MILEKIRTAQGMEGARRASGIPCAGTAPGAEKETDGVPPPLELLLDRGTGMTPMDQNAPFSNVGMEFSPYF